MLWTFRFENGCIVRVVASSFEEAKAKVVYLGPPFSETLMNSSLIEVTEKESSNDKNN